MYVPSQKCEKLVICFVPSLFPNVYFWPLNIIHFFFHAWQPQLLVGLVEATNEKKVNGADPEEQHLDLPDHCTCNSNFSKKGL